MQLSISLMLIGILGLSSKNRKVILPILNKAGSQAIELLENLLGHFKSDNTEKKIAEVCFSVSRLVRSGQMLQESIDKSAETHDVTCEELSRSDMFCSATEISREFGGNSANVFDRVGICLSLNTELKDELKSSLAQIKMSLIVVSLLPVVMMTVGLLFGAGSTVYLLTSIPGLVCLVLGLTCQSLGLIWMQCMLKSSIEVYLS